MKFRTIGNRFFYLTTSGIALLAVYAWLVYERDKDYWPLIVAAAICLALGNADRVRLLKLTKEGFEAETREVINEARDAIAELRKLASKTGEYFLWMMQAEGRMGGGSTTRQKAQFRTNLLSTLRELGLTENEIGRIEEVEHPYIHFDYASYVTRAVTKDMTDAQRQAWNAFFGPGKHQGIGGEPLPAELRSFLEANGLINPETEDRLRDYEHWHAQRTHRRPDAWLERYRGI